MYVYILLCVDDSYYTGVTNDLDKRLWEHENAADPKSYTAKRLPVELVYFIEFYGNPENAIAFEKQIKGWSRAKKESLIKDDKNWERIKQLARKKFE
mgnify:CR=1 FL=1